MPSTRALLTFQQLDVYRRSIEFLALTVSLSSTIPRGHPELVDQLKRAATSIPLNIAEGAGRTARADRSRFCAIASVSAMECAAVLDTLLVLRVMDDEAHGRGLELLGRMVAMLTKMCA